MGRLYSATQRTPHLTPGMPDVNATGYRVASPSRLVTGMISTVPVLNVEEVNIGLRTSTNINDTGSRIGLAKVSRVEKS